MEKEKVFGYELLLDLYQCNSETIRSVKKLQEFVDSLCKLLKMKKYGETFLPYFGLNKIHTAGYSLLQFIETSSITGHFSENHNKCYINIFSCKKYNEKKTEKFAADFFEAKKCKSRFITRE
ncbi:MAG: S-adenosylmethionine decarboxylase-like protein [Parcubacteria group bacterium Athens1014_10]|nr:MAG: S-adenosylmethionine decarboxylase-like protein [Parcubacteria group bacterium Athens1014_10]TSD04996.1 MAG: S-adenosylmethionine decarboxylase-like protein [Parcubacteria group bacterium Athens0714_12]